MKSKEEIMLYLAKCIEQYDNPGKYQLGEDCLGSLRTEIETLEWVLNEK